MPDDKKIIEPIDADFDEVAKAMTPSNQPAVDIQKFLAKAKKIEGGGE